MLTLRGFLKLLAFLVVVFVVLPAAALYLISIPPSGAPDKIALSSVTVLPGDLVRVTFTSDVDIRAYAYRHDFLVDRQLGLCANGEVSTREQFVTKPDVYDQSGEITLRQIANPGTPSTSGPSDASGRFTYRVYFPLRADDDAFFSHDLKADPRDMCLSINNRIKLIGPEFRSNTIIIPRAMLLNAIHKAIEPPSPERSPSEKGRPPRI